MVLLRKVLHANENAIEGKKSEFWLMKGALSLGRYYGKWIFSPEGTNILIKAYKQRMCGRGGRREAIFKIATAGIYADRAVVLENSKIAVILSDNFTPARRVDFTIKYNTSNEKYHQLVEGRHGEVIGYVQALKEMNKFLFQFGQENSNTFDIFVTIYRGNTPVSRKV